MEDTPSTRLRAARIAAGFRSAAAAAERIGVNASTYRAHENGQNGLDPESVVTYARVFGVPASALLYGDAAPALDRPPRRRETPAEFDVVTVPEPDMRAGMGGGGADASAYIWPSDEGVAIEQASLLANWGLPANYLRGHLRIRGDSARVFEVYGDSMYDPSNPGAPGSLFPGDKVIIDTNDVRPSPPGPFLVWDGVGVVVKLVEVVRGDDVPRIRLKSRNPAYSDYEATEEEARIIGRVRAKISAM